MPSVVNSFMSPVSDLLADYQRWTIQWYQRAFSWKEENVIDFVHDLAILAANLDRDANAVHFLGTIIAAEGNSTGPRDKNRDLIDGQQRMTTITLTLCVLRDYIDKKLLKKLEKAESPLARDARSETESIDTLLRFIRDGNQLTRLVLLGDDGPQLEKLIEGKEGVEGNLKRAYDAIAKEMLVRPFNSKEQKVGIEDQLKRCQSLKYALSARMHVNVVLAKDAATASDLFLVVNSRGKPLTPANLLKTQAMKLAIGFSQPSKALTEEAWTGVNRLDEGAKANAQPSRDFLNHFYNSFVGRRATSHTLIAEFTRNVLGFDAASGGSPTEETWDVVHTSMSKARDLFEWARQKPAPSSIPSTWPSRNRSLKEWSRDRFVRLIHLLDAKASLPLMMAATEYLDEETLCRLTYATELGYFRHQMIGGEPNALSNLFISQAAAIRANSASWSLEEYVGKLVALMSYPEADKSDTLMTSGVVTRLKYSSVKSSSIYYFLSYLAQHDDRTGLIDMTAILPVNRASANDIEHIAPQSDTAGEIGRADLIHSIGNLTLWESTPNRVNQDRPFSEKKVGYAESKMSITVALAAENNWGSAQVNERAARLAERAARLFRPELALVASL